MPRYFSVLIHYKGLQLYCDENVIPGLHVFLIGYFKGQVTNLRNFALKIFLHYLMIIRK